LPPSVNIATGLVSPPFFLSSHLYPCTARGLVWVKTKAGAVGGLLANDCSFWVWTVSVSVRVPWFMVRVRVGRLGSVCSGLFVPVQWYWLGSVVRFGG
jgi:hypothetical protein